MWSGGGVAPGCVFFVLVLLFLLLLFLFVLIISELPLHECTMHLLLVAFPLFAAGSCMVEYWMVEY